jgi:lipopolysaccharide export system permease protein
MSFTFVKLKKIDKYILLKFLGTFFLSISLIIVIVIVFDISEKIESFVGKKAPLHAIVFDYYLNFIPYFVNLFSPLFTFIAVIFFTSRMAARSEIVAILSSGLSFWRMLFPYFLASFLIASCSLLLNSYIIPHANKKRQNFEDQYVNGKYHHDKWNIHLQIEPGTFIYIEHYDNDQNFAPKFSMEKIKNNRLYYKLMSDGIKWDSIRGNWQIQNYVIRKISGDKEVLSYGKSLDTTIAMKPLDFGRQASSIETMTTPRLNKYIREEKEKGTPNIELFEIEKYKRVAMPFATFILTLIGVSLSSRKVRGGIGIHIGFGLVISFSYILFMQVSATFATNGQLSPFIAVWIPNILYSFLAVSLVKNAPK